MLGNLKSIFSAECIAESLNELPEVKSTLMDNLFTMHIEHPMAMIGIADLQQTLQTTPLVRRDGAPVPLQEESSETQFFAPLPIKVQVNVSMSELNDLALSAGHNNGIEMWRKNKIDMMRRSIRDTTEGICSTVLTTGKVSWPVRFEGGRMGLQELDYGSPLSHIAMLSASSNMADVYTLLCDMDEKLKQAGTGGNVEFYAGAEVAKVLLSVMHGYVSTLANNSLRMELGQNQIVIGAYTVHFMQEKYMHPVSGLFVDKIPAKQIIAFATDHIGKIFYCAIDSVSANNVAAPFHVVPVSRPDDSGFTLIGQCKPLPVRSSRATCICTVLDS